MDSELKEKLVKIAQVFDIDKLQTINADKNYIRGYYLKNKIPYSVFHTKQNFVHMGVSRDEIFKEEDLLEHVKFVEGYIEKSNATKVLELATGRGANSSWLAKKYPLVSFHGVDLSEGQISFAKREANKFQNFTAGLGDFHNLEQFADSTFDIIFIVEALCHSNATERVMSEVERVLKTNGHFIVYDGYLGNKDLTDDERLAAKITELGMAVAEFLKYDDFKNIAKNVGLEMTEEENLSQFVIPTMQRFEKLAGRFFIHPRKAKFLSWLLPQEFIYNSVSGMLMPVLFKSKVFEYWVTVFQKTK